MSCGSIKETVLAPEEADVDFVDAAPNAKLFSDANSTRLANDALFMSSLVTKDSRVAILPFLPLGDERYLSLLMLEEFADASASA